MLIQHKENGENGSFFVAEGEKQLAEMTYSLSGKDTMIIHHTEVDEALKGKNIGNQLLNRAVEFARTNNLKIIPLCPFASAVFKKRYEEFKDVLK
ncbi:MAG: GNAT family N-acetyltransferase [Ferruginibacter sp.]